MTKWLVFLVLFFLVFSTIPLISQASAHSLFNSAEKFIGGYRVQIATLPEFPQIDEPAQILFRITDADFNEVDRFTMGTRIFFHNDQIFGMTPKSIEGSHYEIDYTFDTPGNHIMKVDLYDMDGQEGVLTYTFNLSTQSPFGYIFIISITIGASVFAIVIGYIYLPKRMPKFRS